MGGAPCEEGAKKVSAMLNGGGGGGTKSFEVVSTQELEILAIVMGGAKGFHPLKGGGGRNKFYPVLKGCKKFRTRDFPIL